MSGLPEDDLDPVEAVEAIARGAVAGVSTAFVAEVLEVLGARRVSVQPSVRVRLGGEWVRPAPIGNVPVAFLGGADAEVRARLRKGDKVLCLVVDRSMDEWLQAGSADATPASRRRHRMTDAVVVGRIEPFSQDDPDDEEGDVSLGSRGGASTNRVLIGPSGISIGDGTNELLTIIHSLISALESTVVATLAGPQPLSSAVTLTALKAQISALKRG